MIVVHYAGLGPLILRRKMHRKCQQKPDLEPIYHFIFLSSHHTQPDAHVPDFFLGVLQGPSPF